MGKAHQAPSAIYNRQFVVSHHAVERFRERVEREFQARDDYDLANLLDERVRHATKHQTVEDTRNMDAVTRVFSIENREGDVYYAVVRDMTVVTVLDEDMLRANFQNGSWKTGPMNMAFRDALKGVRPAPNRIAVPAPRPITLAPKPPDPPIDHVAAASIELGKAMVAFAEKQQAVDAIQSRLNELIAEQVACIEAREDAERTVKQAQINLTNAVTNVTKKETSK